VFTDSQERPPSNDSDEPTVGGVQGRVSNPALVTPKKLASFGIDYLKICIGVNQFIESDTATYLDSIFSQSHNDSNAATYLNQQWPQTDHIVDFTYGRTPHGDCVYVGYEGKNIFSIEKLNPNGGLYRNLNKKYQYTISFYGTFFALIRLGKPLLSFLRFIETGKTNFELMYSISRVDIFSDIFNLNTKQIFKAKRSKSKTHEKKSSKLVEDAVTKLPETYYYGKKNDNVWLARIYNKILDIQAKGTESLYPYYWKEKEITRFEVQVNSGGCRQHDLDLHNIFDTGYLFGVYKSFLVGKYVRWTIVKWIESELNKQGHKPQTLTKYQPTYGEMSNLKYFQQTFNKLRNCSHRLDVPFEQLVQNFIREYEYHQQ